jgi:hypothetical protein
LPYALGPRWVDFAGLDHPGASARAFRGTWKTTARSCEEARAAQDAHRILGEGRRDMAQHACFDVARAAEGFEECACSSCAMALTVKSRRSRSCSSVTDGSAWIAKPW